MRRLWLSFAILAGLFATTRAEAMTPSLRKQAEAALACQMAVRFESVECLSGFVTSPELRGGVACALRGRDVQGCLGVDLGPVGSCAMAGGFTLEGTLACLALRYAAEEAAKCVAGGVGTEGGCFPPDHEARRLARSLMEAERLARWRERVLSIVPLR